MRITEAERKRFHKILDDSIDKMNSPKNKDKQHWSLLSKWDLQKMINVENAELELAVYYVGGDVETENKDLINFNLMMIDNLRGNK